MNKSELIGAVQESTGLDKHKAESAVDAFIGTVMTETRTGNAVTVTGFGTFKPTSRAAREGRNPQTGAPVQIKASKSVKFSASQTLKQAMTGGGGAKKAGSAKKKASSKRATPKKTAKRR